MQMLNYKCFQYRIDKRLDSPGRNNGDPLVFIDYIRASMTLALDNFNLLFKSLVIDIAIIICLGLAVLALDPNYAKNNIPIITSLSTWCRPL